MRLKNKVILITGAGSGIGRATAILFSKEGAKLILNDISEEDLKTTFAAAVKYPPQTIKASLFTFLIIIIT